MPLGKLGGKLRMDSERDGFYAHTDGSPDRRNWQPLQEHLVNVARLAKKLAEPFNAADWAYLAGLWHDVGKYSSEFQQRISVAGGENAHIETVGHVDHSTAGAQHAEKTLGHAGKVLAYTIAGHHGGLPDGESNDSCLRTRLNKDIPSYSACPPELLQAAVLKLPLTLEPKQAGIQLSVFIRMVYSALVDADFLDTEQFVDPEKSAVRAGYRTLIELEPVFFDKLTRLRQTATKSSVNEQRDIVLRQCLTAADRPMGILSLTVPTGGGKTLSSMAFALKHAIKHRLKRIIYVIPFTSIIEQNAEVFRTMLDQDAVLEHHSNFEPENEDYRSRLAAENWDAPVIVTTNVQFFESLFANRSSRCRKLHNISESVVILDEVQTIPAPYLLPCLEMLKELAATYRTSIVLCSATQPAVQKRDDFNRGLEEVTEIIDNRQGLSNALKRTRVTVITQTSDADLAKLLGQRRQVLCVVNTRKHARNLYAAIQDKNGLYHLSALMCPVHRSQVLDVIRKHLRDGDVCKVISTQIVEAGVDIDFPVVYRSMAGIDSIAQAAGRCNREGKLTVGEVFLFRPEKGIPAGYFRQTAQTTESVLRKYSDDVLSLAAIEDYFKLYYWTKGDDALDENGILDDLRAGLKKGDFLFKSIAEKFHFIRDDMKPVVILFDDTARRVVASLDYSEKPAWLSRQLQRYTVAVHPGEWNSLLSMGSIQVKGGMFPVLVDEALYSKDIGLCTDNLLHRDPEEFFI